MALASPLSSRLRSVQQRIEATGRDPAGITIVAVTKGRPVTDCRVAAELGLALGENRVQEALPKLEAIAGAEWHLIGHLQTNKVRQAAGRFALIQSIDSERLGEELARRAPAQPVLLQVNISREAAKQGAAPESAVSLARALDRLLDLRGVMGIGPLGRDPEPAFAELAGLRDDCQQALGRPLPILSMGMSDDFEVALRQGSTMLRLGRVLFG